jgi:hypothetical protein
VSVLLRQPHGFEGLVRGVVVVNLADLPMAKRVDLPPSQRDRRAARAASANGAHGYHDSIIRFDDGLDFRSAPDAFDDVDEKPSDPGTTSEL